VFDISLVHYEPAPKRKYTHNYEPNQFYDQLPIRRIEYPIFDSSLVYLQQDAQQYEHTSYDSNQQLSVPSTPVYQDEYPFFDEKQEGASTSNEKKYLGFDLNKSPPKD